MNSVINFVELENRVISATYRNLMVRAKVVLVDKTSGRAVARSGHHDCLAGARTARCRIRLPDSVKPGAYFLKALNGHGEDAAQSAEFQVT